MTKKNTVPQPATASQALRRLKSGNKKFISDALSHDFQDAGRRRTLASGQNPWAVIVTCADSRVVPELIFDCGLGQLFVIRVAGNIANTCSIASIEYAVACLDVRLVMILGHEKCGAVQAAVDGDDLGYNLNHLLAHIKPALPKSGKPKMTHVIEQNAILSAKELKNRSTVLRGTKGLKIVPAIYRLQSGEVDCLKA